MWGTRALVQGWEFRGREMWDSRALFQGWEFTDVWDDFGG